MSPSMSARFGGLVIERIRTRAPARSAPNEWAPLTLYGGFVVQIEADPTDPQIIQTVYGVGYRFSDDG